VAAEAAARAGAKGKPRAPVTGGAGFVGSHPYKHLLADGYRGNVNPIGIWGVYDEVERYAESKIFAYRRYHKLGTSIVRIFNTYGPRMRSEDGCMIPNFVSQAPSGKPLAVYGRAFTAGHRSARISCRRNASLAAKGSRSDTTLGSPELHTRSGVWSIDTTMNPPVSHMERNAA
jgi:hypothetical protein